MENDSKGLLFDGWHNWLSYTEKAIVGLVKCLISLVRAILFGLISLLVYLFKQIKRFVSAYIVLTLSLLCAFLWVMAVFLFVNLSAKVKTCQMERDSVAYEKMKLEEAFVGDTIIIRGYNTRKEKTVE